MIHFNALDFNMCRSEEVISFFWRSVYFCVWTKALITRIKYYVSIYIVYPRYNGDHKYQNLQTQ